MKAINEGDEWIDSVIKFSVCFVVDCVMLYVHDTFVLFVCACSFGCLLFFIYHHHHSGPVWKKMKERCFCVLVFCIFWCEGRRGSIDEREEELLLLGRKMGERMMVMHARKGWMNRLVLYVCLLNTKHAFQLLYLTLGFVLG